MSNFSAVNYALSKKLDNAILSGVVSHSVDNVNKTLTFTFSDGTSSTLQFNYPTNDKDTPETKIEFDENALGLSIVSNNSYYKVINGICYGTIEILVSTPSNDKLYGYTKINTTSIPKVGFKAKYVLNMVEISNTISVVLDKGSTDIKILGKIPTNEGSYSLQGSFSYPVA